MQVLLINLAMNHGLYSKRKGVRMRIEQYRQYLDMMNQWLILKQEGKSIGEYLKKSQYSSVAIYGMAIYGRHTIRELEDTDITIAYGIDMKKMKPYKGIEVLQPTGKLPPADLIINTVIHENAAIAEVLVKLTSVPVISLEDIVFGAYGQ